MMKRKMPTTNQEPTDPKLVGEQSPSTDRLETEVPRIQWEREGNGFIDGVPRILMLSAIAAVIFLCGIVIWEATCL